MKIRTGFVSNSSSSSFIVSFDRVPETWEETMKMMFGPGAESAEIVQEYDYTTSTGRIAKEVFDDIQNNQEKDLGRESLIAMFEGRYSAGTYDPIRQQPRACKEDWYGLNEDALMAWYLDKVETERTNEERSKKMRRLVENNIGRMPQYGTPGHKEWLEKKHEFTEADDECKKLREEESESWRVDWDREDALKKKVAEADVDGFLKDNRGCKILYFHYSDNDGDLYVIMEHGGIFRRLPHVRISHH